MKIFTQEELSPSESTLRLIKQIAHACNALKRGEEQAASLYLN